VKLLLLGLSLILVLVARVIQASPQEQTSTPSIQGKVLQEPDGQPIRKANVMVGAKSNNLRDYITESVTLDGRDVVDSGFPVDLETYVDVVISAKGAGIAGTVVDGNGQPIANATVVDVPAAEHRTRLDLYQQDTTDESGHFSLRGLNPGKYTVFALEELQEDFRQPEFLKSYETRGQVVELDKGTRKSVVLKLISNDPQSPWAAESRTKRLALTSLHGGGCPPDCLLLWHPAPRQLHGCLQCVRGLHFYIRVHARLRPVAL
jgi:Carboxypeptidase regulatory-like domain